MPVTNSDAVLHYDVGIYGKLGYGVPNPSDDLGSLNPTILEFVNGAGAQLFTIMHHPDADMRVPPRLNTIMRIHKLYLNSTRLLAGRMVPHNKPDMEARHIQVGGDVFRAHPCPYFLVRNIRLKRWASYIMLMMSEAMQHTENRRPIEISEDFAALMGQYLKRVYREMAIELFGKSRDEVENPLFTLTDGDFNSYDPTALFPQTEALDTVPPLNRVLTEDQLGILRDGIPYTEIANLKPWPVNLSSYYEKLRPHGGAGHSPGAVDTTGNVDGGQENREPEFETPYGGSLDVSSAGVNGPNNGGLVDGLPNAPPI